jgi:CO/xanthine dehydrogenase Mo-binding subunit
MATKRPVKFSYTREESMIAQSKRHPFIIRMKTGVTKKGYLTACQVEVIGDILSHKLGIDPIQFRLQNAYNLGSSTPNSQILTHSVGVKETIKEAADMTGWKEGRQ